jgi:hypothetical protein
MQKIARPTFFRILAGCLWVGICLAAACLGAALAAEQGPNAAPGQNAPGQFDSQARNRDQNLSDRLDRSGGVIHPPGNVDPDIRVPPPATGDKMPVVPVPGSPGGDPSVKPK